jgi:hypothetical protein
MAENTCPKCEGDCESILVALQKELKNAEENKRRKNCRDYPTNVRKSKDNHR